MEPAVCWVGLGLGAEMETSSRTHRVFQVALVVRNLPVNAGDIETWVRSLGRKGPLEEGMTTHSSILPWRIARTEEAGRLQSMGSQGVGHDWSDSARTRECFEQKTDF